MRRVTGAVVIAAGLGLVVGCGGPGAGAREAGGPRDALAELGQVLKDLADEGRKPPAKPADLAPIDPMLPLAGPMLRDGSVVYVWGTGYAAGGKKVAAHEKKVPGEGGLVLLQDGTVTEMTADEFRAAKP